MSGFSYEKAFSRNIGWVTEWEQAALRGKRVAIAGMGGVGGVHLLTLTRLGIGAFNIADFDTYDIVNFNRQVGANMATIGRPKLEVMAEMALAINPELRIERFPNGIRPEDVDAFLSGVDLFVDGFDFFVLGIRRQVFARCAELGIPAITAAPIGMGVGFLAFVPGGMTFEQYFRLEGQSENEQYLRFLMGVAPRGLHRSYLVDPSRIDLAGKKGPSTGASCQLCSGVATVAALKLLLGRGDVKPAPYHHHFDPYVGKLAITKLRYGMNGPVQRAKLAVARRMYLSMQSAQRPKAADWSPSSPVEAVLDIARWAPSGDNTQPWSFEIIGEDTVAIHPKLDITNPYEYRQAEPSVLALGMLLETMRIAASRLGRRADWTAEHDGTIERIVVRFPPAPGLEPDELESYVTVRSVDRRAYRARPLTGAEKVALAAELGPELSVRWFESRKERWRLARLSARATDIRLRAPEMFPIHQRIIDWTSRYSRTGIPALAVGLDPASLRLMRWGMQDWSRMQKLNRIVGTRGAAVQLDLLPGLRSAAFFAISAAQPRQLTLDELLGAGQRLQRFWLRATKLGLALQPSLAILLFGHYGSTRAAFTSDPALQAKAEAIAADFPGVVGRRPEEVLFIGRIGEPQGPSKARSIRRSVADLIREPLPAV